MSWDTARAQLVTILGAVSITTPIAASIKRVYPYRPANQADFPCVVLRNPPGKTLIGRGGATRKVRYDVPIEVYVRDADLQRAGAILDAFEDAITDAFDSAVTLDLGAGMHVQSGPDWQPADEVALSEGSSTPATYARGILTLVISEAKSFGA